MTTIGKRTDAETQAKNYYTRIEEQLTDTVEEMESALVEWEKKAKSYYKEKTRLEAWEASTKRALMISGKSGIAAEAVMKCEGEVQTGIGSNWAHRTNELNNAMIAERVAHKRLRIAEMKWETERSKAATLRTLV